MKTVLIAVLMGASLVLAKVTFGQESFYYTCSYENNYWGTNILFTKISIDTKQIVYSSTVDLTGEIETPKPIEFRRGNRRFYFIATNRGTASKNSTFQDTAATYYSILNEDGIELLSGKIPFVFLFSFRSFAGDSIELRYIRQQNGDNRRFKALLRLDNSRGARLISLGEDTAEDSASAEIAGFSNYNQIDISNNNTYWDLIPRGLYIIRIDPKRNSLIDSLFITNDMEYSYLFALSNVDSTIYSFHINYNEMGGPESLSKRTVDPSYVIKYNLEALTKMDSIIILNPSLDYGYVFGEIGSIDWVGPYLVHFYFEGEDYRYFSPAMLFIFDTRTNETTWLRVGWR